jgi:4-amino-4-deoxy-L-arabinose transferase-like glycosyltransferase
LPNRHSKRAIGIVAAAVFLLAPLLAWWLPGETYVRVMLSPGAAFAEVNGTRLDIPADQLDPSLLSSVSASSALLKVEPLEKSTNWQPAQQNPFVPLGLLGEAIQSVRPTPQWTLAGSGGPDSALYRLKAGWAPAELLFVPSGSTSGYAFLIEPQRHSLAWWRTEGSDLTEELVSASYRPRGLTSTDDFLSEVSLIVWVASALALLALAVDAALRRLSTPKKQAARSGIPPGHLWTLREDLIAWLSLPFQPAIALFLAGTILTALVCLFVLDGIPHVQDDVAYIFQARIFALFRSWVPVPPGPEFFQNGFILMYQGRWFTKYPPGYPLLLAPTLWVGFPWLVNTLSAGVSLALVYACGLRMYGRRVAAWAGLLGLVSPWILIMSGSYMSHPTTMMWAILFVYCLVRMHDKPLALWREWIGWPLLAGFAIGMAFITREWTAFGIGVGAGLWGLTDILSSRPAVRQAVSRYALVLAGFVPPLLFLLYENRQLTGDWLRFAQDLVGSYDTPGFGPGHGSPEGHTPALGVYNALVYLRALTGVFDGWPGPLALAPIALGLVAWVADGTRRYLKWDTLVWLCAVGLLGAYFLWWSATTIYGPRYWYEAMPFLLLVAGRGLDLLGRLASWSLQGRRASLARWLAPGVLFALLTVYNLTQALPYRLSQYVNYNDISVAALQSVEKEHLRNALVFVQLEPSRSNRDFGKVFFADDPLLRGRVVYARDLGTTRNKGLLGFFPGRTPYWLPLNGPPQPGFGP